MRLDKFMQVSRIIKRRTIAKEVADLNLVTLNGKSAKPSAEVKENDVIGVTYRGESKKYRIESIKPPKASLLIGD